MSGLIGVPLEPRRRTPSRPYARKRGGPPSVTTVIDSLNKPGLSWAAARETAEYAVRFPEKWQDRDEADAIDHLYRIHRGLWDSRAAMGTVLHAINEAWTWEEDVDLDALVYEAANRDKTPVRAWQGRETLVASDLEGYVDGLEKFWREFTPRTIATEEVVRHSDKVNPFIGQRDWVCELDNLEGRTLLDIKTTAQTDAEKGLYPDAWRLQLAAYRGAEELVLYDDAGNEVETRPAYAVARCCILHLRGDGDYSLYEVQAGGTEYNRFLQLIGLWRWVQKESREPAPLLLEPRDSLVPALAASVG